MPADPLVVTGIGHVVAGDRDAVDPRPFLRNPKNRKFMGLQDRMAVVAAGRALAAAGLAGGLGERAGLYLVVGFIPFEAADIDPLMNGSVAGGRLSMAAFSTTGVGSVNPLLTFRCLPNMPAYHVSTCFDVEGPYLVTYPGPAQLYLALAEARQALAESAIDVALVGAVADQRNLLVEHHFARCEQPVTGAGLGDAAGFLVLEPESRAAGRAAAEARELCLGYTPFDPLRGSPRCEERFQRDGLCSQPPAQLGAASLPVMLALAGEAGARELRHELVSRDGYRASSRWELR